MSIMLHIRIVRALVAVSLKGCLATNPTAAERPEGLIKVIMN
jgi:hypothetical protein